MNKILVNDGKKIEIKEDTDLFLELSSQDDEINIDVLDNVRSNIKILGEKVNVTVNINVHQNSKLYVNNLFIDSNVDLDVSLAKRDSEIECINSMLSSKESNLRINIRHNYESTKSLVINNGLVLDDNRIIFEVNGIIGKDSKRSICLQDNKIITKYDNLSTILPNLYIENYDVEAEHSAYIGDFSEEDLFYLMSRGISKSDAELLLIKSFLLGKMRLSDDEMNIFMNEVIKKC